MRHGETEWSRNGRHTGNTDLPLTAEGAQNASTLPGRLAALRKDRTPFSHIYSSPLTRARETAALAGYANPTTTDLLREYDYGDYEGLTSKQIRETRPDWQLFRDGCPNGETPPQIQARAEKFLNTACKDEEADAIAFSHGHLIRVVATTFLGLDIQNAASLNLDTAAICILRQDQDRRLLQLWNSSAVGSPNRSRSELPRPPH